jgi:hypothetical protein
MPTGRVTSNARIAARKRRKRAAVMPLWRDGGI